MRKSILIGGMAAIVAAGFVIAQRAWPNPLPVPMPSPAPAPPASGPTITWSVPQFTQTMFPGASSTVTVSFQSDQNLAGVAVDVTASLSGIVSASPASFNSIAANQPYQITLKLSPPPAFIKQSFGGTIHLRNAGSPPKTYAPPLTVGLTTDFLSFTDNNTGISFAFPPMDTSVKIFSAPSTATSAATLDVAAFDPVINNFVPMIGITIDTNPGGLTLQQWFEQKIDINGLLVTSGAAQEQQLSNGLSAIFITGQIPDQYLTQGGPVSDAYLMAPSGDRVLIIDQPQDAALADFGTSTEGISTLLPTILGSLTFH